MNINLKPWNIDDAKRLSAEDDVDPMAVAVMMFLRSTSGKVDQMSRQRAAPHDIWKTEFKAAKEIVDAVRNGEVTVDG